MGISKRFAVTTVAAMMISTASAFILSTSAWAEGITVSPVRSEFTVDPGQVKGGELKLKNSSKGPVTIRITAQSFSVINDQYDYRFDSDKPELSWVSFDNSEITLGPNEKNTVSYAVSVPVSSEPGGYYIALLVQTVPDLPQTIAPVEGVASLLYVTVSGELTKRGEVIALNTPWLAFDTIKWSATVHNKGNVHFRSTYSSDVVDGNTGSDNVTNSRLILPGTVRYIDAFSATPVVSGLYRVTYRISLGDAPAYSAERWVVVIRPVQALLTLAIIGALLLGFWPRRVRTKR